MCRCIEVGGRRSEVRGWLLVVFFAIVVPAQAGTQFPGIGRPATPGEIAAWDIDVRPDFKGLPPGSGSVADGQKIWDAKCAGCHGTFGESNEVFAPLVGGTTAEDVRTGHARALITGDTARTTLMKLASLSTLWDYVNRAMPWNAPKSLTTNEVYAVVAYLLNLGDLVPDDFVLSNTNMAQVQARLPNRAGLSTQHGLGSVNGQPDTANVACMKDCPTEVKLASVFPDHAKSMHGDLVQQQRAVGATSAVARRDLAAIPAAGAERAPAADDLMEVARSNACLQCHSLDKKVVGPAFRDVARRYRGDASAAARLAAKITTGGAGSWGSVPMPPNAGLAEADATRLARWVLGL
jgi:cytochrome c551/c552